MNVGEALLSLILGFIFSFIGVQSSGHTDINPVTVVAKVFSFLPGGQRSELIDFSFRPPNWSSEALPRAPILH